MKFQASEFGNREKASDALGASWFETATSYLSPTAVAAAQKVVSDYAPAAISLAVGASIGPDGYTSVPEEMKAMPSDIMQAYAQAMFWTSFAAKRAAFDHNAGAQTTILSFYALLAQEAGKASPPWSTAAGLACHTTGYGCPTRGRVQVLQDSANAIRTSSLAQGDKDKITAVLLSAKRSVQFREALPLLLSVSAGALIGRWAWRKYHP